jgi:hypothetical protein
MIITQIIIIFISTLWVIIKIILFITHIIILKKLKNIYNINYLGPDDNSSELGHEARPITIRSNPA